MKKVFKKKYKFANSTCKKGDCRNNKLSVYKNKFNKNASEKNSNSDTILKKRRGKNGSVWFNESGISIKKGKIDRPTRFNFYNYNSNEYYGDD